MVSFFWCHDQVTGYSFWYWLRIFLHKFAWIVFSVHKLNNLGKLLNLWTFAEYHVKLWLISKFFTTISCLLTCNKVWLTLSCNVTWHVVTSKKDLSFSNCSYTFMNLYNFFQFEFPFFLVISSRNKLKKHYDTKNCSELSLFE